MFVRRVADAPTVEWGSGVSTRIIVESDGMGFGLHEVLVRAGTTSRMQYPRHVEAVLCTSGRGSLIEADGTTHLLEPGVLYALNDHDAHTLIADEAGEGMRMFCVFNPPLTGDEVHVLTEDGYSQY